MRYPSTAREFVRALTSSAIYGTALSLLAGLVARLLSSSEHAREALLLGLSATTLVCTALFVGAVVSKLIELASREG
jgi:hypothetical protein